MTAKAKTNLLGWAVGILLVAVAGVVYYYEVHQKKTASGTGETEA